jgi:hypothetical protein
MPVEKAMAALPPWPSASSLAMPVKGNGGFAAVAVCFAACLAFRPGGPRRLFPREQG